MKIFLFFILAILWLGVMFKWQMRKDARRESALSLPGERGEWTTVSCRCGSLRKDWEPIEVSRENFTLLLRCPQCGQLWEEKLEGRAYNKWREVDHIHVSAFYTYEPGDKA